AEQVGSAPCPIRRGRGCQAPTAAPAPASGHPRLPDDVALDPSWPTAVAGEDQDRQALVDAALAHRPELAAAQHAIDAADDSLSAVRFGLRPSVTVGAAVDWTRHDKDLADPPWTTGLTLSVPRFDAGPVGAPIP